ncbi:MAG: phosphodiesterase [Gammaproteobacteria bacterium]|nr:MAG: phosphodiesterase [Gammaproteobacteria bacterium]
MLSALQNNQPNVLQFAHITDTHLLNQSEDTFNGLNTKNSLESVLSHIQSNYADIDFLLLTGDVSQTGDQQSYNVLKTILQQYAFPIYCVPGNHDVPNLLQQVISNCPYDSINIIQMGKFSLVLLSSWVDEQNHGVISQNCLQQLKMHLKNSEGQFNIFAMHHPPVLINSKWLDELGLMNKTEFITLVENYSQDALVLFGHIHQDFDQQKNKLRLLSTPSTCYQFKKYSDTIQVEITPPPSYRIVNLDLDNHQTINIRTKIHHIE